MEYFIKVCFLNNNKHYNFLTEDDSIQINQKLVVETVKGIEIATAVSRPIPMELYNSKFELKPILRIANENDLALYEANLEKGTEAAKVFVEETTRLELDMKLLSTEYTLDGTKVLFTYSSPDRVDFRELLKILAFKLKARIELKQIAPRDRAQLIGGLGPCGLPLCCATFLTEFDGISLNRAKNQLLTINIPKLSGQCGKLLCCLKYEDDFYTEAKTKFPEVGTPVKVNDIEYKISSFNVLSNNVRLESENNIIYLPLDEVDVLLGRKKKEPEIKIIKENKKDNKKDNKRDNKKENKRPNKQNENKQENSNSEDNKQKNRKPNKRFNNQRRNNKPRVKKEPKGE